MHCIRQGTYTRAFYGGDSATVATIYQFIIDLNKTPNTVQKDHKQKAKNPRMPMHTHRVELSAADTHLKTCVYMTNRCRWNNVAKQMKMISDLCVV